MTPSHDNPSEPSTLEPGEPEVLLFETSPYGTLDAIVQHDGRAVFFYLNQSKPASTKFGTRACWVRNLKLGPYVINQDEMRAGISPMLPRTDCVHREGQPLPDPEKLEIVWFEEGNGAALIERVNDPSDSKSSTANLTKTLAVIPPWSGLEGFNGYALECASESPLCWPMPDNPKLQTRIEAAIKFWASFRSNPDGSPSRDPFLDLQTTLMAYYDSRFKSDHPKNKGQKTTGQTTAQETQYYSIDGGAFPPRGLVEYQNKDGRILATVGMSLCPQPAVEIFSDTPQRQRRIELGLWIPKKIDSQNGVAESALQKLSGLAGYPWRNFTWLGAGHTCAFEGVFPSNPSATDSTPINSAVLIHDSQFCKVIPANPIQEQFRDDPINLLWLTPLSDNQKAQLNGNSISLNDILQEYYK